VIRYFDESFRQLSTAMTMPISTVIGPMIDHVVVLLIGLPRSTPNPWSAQMRPNSATITPNASVTTKVLFIQGCYKSAVGVQGAAKSPTAVILLPSEAVAKPTAVNAQFRMIAWCGGLPIHCASATLGLAADPVPQ
jgi:hypothetical protein